MDINNNKIGRFLGFVIIIALLAGIYWSLSATGFIDFLLDTASFKIYVQSSDYWGVLLIISLMAFAILFKLLPSAAVALASGAAYGHTWGTIYIILGAWLGAIIAFSITRLLGNDALCRLSGRHIKLEQEQSQSWLMWGLLISRFIPIIPYDIVSYAMGLTPLKLWRFSIATLIGVIPTSFFLAHVGGELATINFNEMFAGMMLAGIVVLLPVSIAMFVFFRCGQFKSLFSIKKCASKKNNE